MILHPSHLQTYTMCPAKYNFEYVQNTPPGFHSWPKVRGTIIHNVLYHGLDSFNEIFEIGIDVHEKEAPIFAKVGQIERDKPDMLEQCQNYFKYLATYKIRVLEREWTRQYRIADTDFEGTVDAIAVHQDTPTGMMELHDYKTGQKWGSHVLNRNLQLSHYYILGKQNGLNVNRVFWGHTKDLLRYKRDGKRAVRGEFRGPFLYPLEISDADIPIIERWTKPIVSQINRPEMAFYAAHSSMALCENCEYNHVCPALQVGIKDDSAERAIAAQERLTELLKQSITREDQNRG